MKKKIIVAVVLMAGVTAVAVGNFSNNKNKITTEKKVEKKKKTCNKICPFS